jgi:hypothetical protein
MSDFGSDYCNVTMVMSDFGSDNRKATNAPPFRAAVKADLELKGAVLISKNGGAGVPASRREPWI